MVNRTVFRRFRRICCFSMGIKNMLHKNSCQKEEKAIPSDSKKYFFRSVAITMKSHKLGDLLVASGLLTPQQLRTALLEQKETKEQLGKILLRHGALSPVQLYQKLAEQWCLKVSTAGMAVLMQTMTPSVARADDMSTVAPHAITAQFTLAAATVPSAYKPAQPSKQYPSLFGTQEVRSDDITAFKKWTTVMQRFENQMKTRSATSPRVMLWKAAIQELKDKSAAEKIRGVNNFLNQVAYVEDTMNYKKTDYWATPIEFLTRGGDCEDFAIAKYASLRALGFSPDQLRIAIVQDKIKNIPHAILVVYSDDGNFILDNQDKKAEYVANVTRYKPIFSINSNSWWLHRA